MPQPTGNVKDGVFSTVHVEGSGLTNDNGNLVPAYVKLVSGNGLPWFLHVNTNGQLYVHYQAPVTGMEGNLIGP